MSGMDGADIQRERLRRKMGRRELANLIGVTEQTIGLWERSERTPSFGHLQRLRAVLFGQGLPAAELDVPTRVAALEVQVAALTALVAELAAARLEDDPRT